MRAGGILTPLNHADVLAVDADRGHETVNWLKGSWNLSLFTEGWLFSSPACRKAAREALHAVPAAGNTETTGPIPQ